MKISFSPVRSDARLELSLAGEVLTINGTPFDMSGIPEGAYLPREAVHCAWLLSDIERRAGQVHLTLLLPYGADAAQAVRFPKPITVTQDGPVTLPRGLDKEDAA